jgi:hypothetical protein
MAGTPASLSGCYGFKSRPGDGPFSVSPGNIQDSSFIKLDHGRFLTHPFEFIILQLFYNFVKPKKRNLETPIKIYDSKYMTTK